MNSILIFIFNITIMCVCVWMCEPFSKTVQFSNWKRRRNKSRYLFIFNYCEFRLKLVFYWDLAIVLISIIIVFCNVFLRLLRFVLYLF